MLHPFFCFFNLMQAFFGGLNERFSTEEGSKIALSAIAFFFGSMVGKNTMNVSRFLRQFANS